ncbi:outer mitochondrial transmembrane helix translocase isoform X2 [Nymphaea colorata]|uniref:outer mitochondrial transmembrane helix translocase isoform X2 n=1 Tax=Nymphaea colorata TaxID=210225 RepID=UPI00214EBCA5|nr:outer mitochondrial transmembrane helix translocase isoform X2 [Nymphaea colorata]
MSKYYGESERLLGTVFTLANDLSTGAIVFLDEVDSFAATRDSDMHEATRRILSVLLRQIDGFGQGKRVVVIAATNRKQDLDPALMRMSGRDIRDVCQCAERHWASKIIRGETPDSTTKSYLPPLEDYLESAIRRRQTLLDFTKLTYKKPNSHTINQSLAFAS